MKRCTNGWIKDNNREKKEKRIGYHLSDIIDWMCGKDDLLPLVDTYFWFVAFRFLVRVFARLSSCMQIRMRGRPWISSPLIPAHHLASTGGFSRGGFIPAKKKKGGRGDLTQPLLNRAIMTASQRHA